LHDVAPESAWPDNPHDSLVTPQPTIADLIEHHTDGIDSSHEPTIDDLIHHHGDGIDHLASNFNDPEHHGDGLHGFMDDLLHHDEGLV
jgi:hypothetical protein